MTDKQIASILNRVFENKSTNIDQFIEQELEFYNIVDNDKNTKNLIAQKFKNGIVKLNPNQFNNILDKISQLGFDEELIKSRLKFYEIDKTFVSEIVEFFKNCTMMNIPVDVSNIDEKFKGVQVASRDNFNTIINQGWTGDWVVTPENIVHKKVQVASMNELGRFPRGFYLNADIERLDPVQYADQIRYRIHIKNPVVIDSGNRNVKFNVNPVRYID